MTKRMTRKLILVVKMRTSSAFGIKQLFLFEILSAIIILWIRIIRDKSKWYYWTSSESLFGSEDPILM
jgi:hypothetical protein